jgi:hypothetical protein
MDHHEKMRLRAAAFRVTKLFPGAIGDMICRELMTWEEFGYRLGGEQLVMKVVDDVLKLPFPVSASAGMAERAESYRKYKSAVGYEG